MSEPTPPSPAAPASGDFHVWRDIDRLDRRIDVVASQIGQLDQFGSRGVDALRQEVQTLSKDIKDHEQVHKDTTAAQAKARQFQIGMVVALIGPLYPLILLILTHHQ